MRACLCLIQRNAIEQFAERECMSCRDQQTPLVLLHFCSRLTDRGGVRRESCVQESPIECCAIKYKGADGIYCITQCRACSGLCSLNYPLQRIRGPIFSISRGYVIIVKRLLKLRSVCRGAADERAWTGCCECKNGPAGHETLR